MKTEIFTDFKAQKFVTFEALKTAERLGIFYILNKRRHLTIQEYLREVSEQLGIKSDTPALRRAMIVLMDLLVECSIVKKEKQGYCYKGIVSEECHHNEASYPAELSGYMDFFRLCSQRIEKILHGSTDYIKFTKEYIDIWNHYLCNPVFDFARDIMVKLLSLGIKVSSPEVLVLCYGTGEDIGKLQNILPESMITGIDFTDIFARIARTKAIYPERIKELRRWNGFGTPIPFDDESFDIVVFSCADPYIPENLRELVYKDIFRVLKKGGRLGILTGMYPDRQEAHIKAKWIRAANLAHDFLETACSNWQGFYDVSNTIKLFKKIGFNIKNIMLNASVWRVDRPQ